MSPAASIPAGPVARQRPALGLLLGLLLSFLGAAPAALAGERASGSVGEAAANFTQPLPAPELSDGELTVKVVGPAGMQDAQVGQQVELLRLLEGGDEQSLQSVATGEDGRSRFSGLISGASYAVRVAIPGENARCSLPFVAPARGGLRLLLALGAPGGAGEDGTPGAASAIPGHPPAAQLAAGARLPPGHPHLPAAAGSSAARRLRDARAPQIEAAPELAAGQLEVRVVKGKEAGPLAGAAVTVKHGGLDVALGSASGQVGEPPAAPVAPAPPDRQAGSSGRAANERYFQTDAEGRLLLHLSPLPAAGLSPEILVKHDGLSYHSGPLVLPPEGGVRLTFTVFERTIEPRQLVLGPGSHLVCQIGERALGFMLLLELENRGETVFDPGPRGFALPLPEGAINIEVPAELGELLQLGPDGRTARLVAPLAPGVTSLRAHFELPYEGPSLDVRLRAPLALEESFIAVLEDMRVQVLGPSVTDERGEVQQTPDGRRGRVFALAAVSAGGVLEITLTSLPHRSRRAQTIVLLAAAMIALWAVFAALGGPRWADARRARREELLDELARLEARGGRSRGGAASPRDGRQVAAREELRELWED